MTYKIITKNYLSPKNKTEITISEDEVGKYTYITRELPGNLLNDSDEVLIQSILDRMAVEYNPGNKLSEMEAEIASYRKEFDEFIATARKEVDEIKDASAIAQGAIMELYEQFSGVTDSQEGEGHAETAEESLEGGE